MQNKDYYIFTIGYKCGEILGKAIETFHKYHDEEINIYGTYKDFKLIPKHKNNIYHEMSEDKILEQLYKNGHLGTAYIFSKIIQNEFTDKQKIIHFDSDVIFRDNCMKDIIVGFDAGYDLIGSRRCYKNNLNGRKDLNDIQDVVQTYLFGFNKEKISKYDTETMLRMSVGYYNPLNHPILDFFDPVSFDILKNNGKILFLDYDLYGGMNIDGNKLNKFGEINQRIDFGSKIIHFAGVGSGMNFYFNDSLANKDYQDWAKSQFVIYQKLFKDENFKGEYDKSKYELIKKELTNE